MELMLQVVCYQSINRNDKKAGGKNNGIETLIRFWRNPKQLTPDGTTVRSTKEEAGGCDHCKHACSKYEEVREFQSAGG